MRTRDPRAFTLIEVVFCIAIFAIGFAAVATLLPAGLLMERETRNTTDAAICGRNALEIVKGKGIQTLTTEYTSRPNRLALQQLSINSAGSLPTTGDAEAGAFASGQTLLGFPVLHPYFDTDADNAAIYAGGGMHNIQRLYAADATNWQMGRIHAFKNRPVPGTRGYFSMLDLSYPSVLLDVSARTYVSSLQVVNRSTTPGPNGDQRAVDPATNSWLITAITLAMTAGTEWPEQTEGDPTNPARPAAQDFHTTSTPLWLTSNDPSDLRSRTGGQIGVPGRQPCEYGYCTGSFQDLMDNLMYNGGAPGRPWYIWNWCTYTQFSDATVKDPSDGRYRIPCPLVTPAIVYNKSQDLILMRYPQVFARAPVAGNTRVNNFRTTYGITPANWTDRRLKKGDTFMALQLGVVFTVRDAYDPGGEPKSTGVAGTNTYDIDPASVWTDGTYQLVRVTPSLATTPFSDNVPIRWGNPTNGYGEQLTPDWTTPQLTNVVVAPPPVTGGASPWAATSQLVCGNNEPAQSNTAQNPFRSWANTAE